MTIQTCSRCGKKFEKRDYSIYNICPECKAKKPGNFKLWKYVLFVGAILIVALISKCFGV
jgi:predicted amidophosphoribosyltransferase